MKMKYSTLFLVPFLMLALCTSVLFETGCTSQQFAQVVDQIQAQLPIVQQDAVVIATFAAPQVVPIVNLVNAAVNLDLPLLKAAIADWQANPTTSTRQKIEAIVDDLVTKVDAQLLAANGMTKTPDVQALLLSLGLLASTLHVIDGFIVSAQTKAQAQTHAAAHTAKLHELLPLMDEKTLSAAAEQNGTTLQGTLRYQLALGF